MPGSLHRKESDMKLTLPCEKHHYRNVYNRKVDEINAVTPINGPDQVRNNLMKGAFDAVADLIRARAKAEAMLDVLKAAEVTDLEVLRNVIKK